MEKIQKLLDYQKEITDLQYTINILTWDLRISAPKKTSDELIKLITAWEEKLFKLQKSEEYKQRLLDAIKSEEFKSLEEAEQRYILNLYKHYEENTKVPVDFYSKYTELKNKSNVIWRDAKANKDYEMFKPYLKELIEMTKTYYRYIDSETENLYDIMLNQYETGITSKTIDKLFNELKESLVPLIKKVANNDVVDYEKTYTDEVLFDCARYLLDYIGLDNDKCTLGFYPHGFMDRMGSNDIRIAFKRSNNPTEFVTTIIHEGGHSLLEQNIKTNLSRYENKCIDNLYALHESQSRFYENILGRNINFWIPIYDEIKEKLNLDISIEEFSKALNTVKLGKIRTDADELTYCLHIIVRYEIERDLFNGKINVDELPKIWNDKMKEYLNVEVINDSEGLMQDVHWSEGAFGYFPSYLLGTIFDGIFKEVIETNLGSIDDLLKEGKIKEITNFLIENIYKNGGAYTSLEVIEKIYKKELSAKPIIKYFEDKYR